MISALIIDDEYEAVRGLEAMLTMFCPGVNIIGTAGSMAEALPLIHNSKPQLLFLDIEMKDGSGFDLLDNLPFHNFAIVFVTAFDQYAIRAIRLNALDYLLKPVDPDELTAAVEKVETTIRKNQYPDYSHLLNGHREGVFKKIGVPTSKGILYLDLEDIIRLESSNNYTYIYTATHGRFLITKTIKIFEAALPVNTFIRCHQRHIVNVDHVNEYDKTEGGSLIAGSFIIPVSRGNRERVEKMLESRFPRI